MASRVVRARLDDASEPALAALMREGRNESEAVRTALIEAGHLAPDEQRAVDDVLELVLGL
ncbi:MAG TPA: hypothetical protein VH276_11765 [Solirubrobacteraceae bacterium]|nr:hypothetical protein [Solirubrobacteraceae bacterium]